MEITSETSKKKTVPRRTAQDWVVAALGVLARGSIADVKVERLAKQLQVTKGSFYWHFADRRALLDAMLALWVTMDTEQIIALVDEQADPDDPKGSLARLLEVTVGTVTELDGVEAGIREWAATDSTAANVCAEVDARRLEYVADLLVASGVDPVSAAARAGVIYRMVIGEYTWRRHGGASVDLDAALSLVEHFSRI